MEDENGEPWFVAKDVCKVLEIQNARDAISVLDEDEKITVDISDANPRAGIPHEMNLISESGLYALVFRSRKPEAKAFSKWVRSEVLPAIRKTGRYAQPGRKLSRNIQLPTDLPMEALELKPALRQRLWRDALDTVRLEGGDIDMAIIWFGKLCRMMACDCVWASSKSKTVNEFVAECCIASPGSRVKSSTLYEAMRQWTRGKGTDMPSMKAFGAAMTQIAPNIRSNGSWYTDIRLK